MSDWMNTQRRRLAQAVARLALRRGGRGFSANDLPADLKTVNRGDCGAVIGRLVSSGVLRPVGWRLGGGFVPKVERNAGGNKIGVYALANAAAAREVVNDPS